VPSELEVRDFNTQIFFTTSRIHVAWPGGQSIGTGFLCVVPLEESGSVEGPVMRFLVSNRHVFVNPSYSISFGFHQNRPRTREPDVSNWNEHRLDDFSAVYFAHPDSAVDLACINVTGFTGDEHGVYTKQTPIDRLIELDLSTIAPGEEIWYAGYPDGLFDQVNNLPILRKGFLASIPTVPFNGRPQILADANIQSGSSGSPVYISLDHTFHFLGVVTEQMVMRPELNLANAQEGEENFVELSLGLGLVLRGELVFELLSMARNHFNSMIASH